MEPLRHMICSRPPQRRDTAASAVTVRLRPSVVCFSVAAALPLRSVHAAVASTRAATPADSRRARATLAEEEMLIQPTTIYKTLLKKCWLDGKAN